MKYILHLLSSIIILSTVSCGQNTPLAEYAPKSHQEEALKNVLLNFQAGINRKDSKKIADLLHENASIMIGRDREIVSKPKYIKILPQRLAENPTIALGKPKMTISDNQAKVKIYIVSGNLRFLITYYMQFDNNKWYIKSWKY